MEELLPTLKRATWKLVQENGVIRSIDPIGLRALPHRMKRFKEYDRFGMFIRVRVDCRPQDLQEYENILANEFDVLRWMTRKIDNKDILREYLYFYPKSKLRNLIDVDLNPDHVIPEALQEYVEEGEALIEEDRAEISQLPA